MAICTPLQFLFPAKMTLVKVPADADADADEAAVRRGASSKTSRR